MPVLHGLYAITDSSLDDDNTLGDAVEQALRGGARLLQYRDKSDDCGKRLRQANLLKTLCAQHDALLIINDDVELAKQSRADGVHLGQDDASLEQARAVLGKRSIVGISCYNRLALARQAQQQGADYVAFGAFYPSPTKPDAAVATLDLLQQARAELTVPACAIGGITVDNAPALVKAGADMLAVISGVFRQPDIKRAASQFSRLFR